MVSQRVQGGTGSALGAPCMETNQMKNGYRPIGRTSYIAEITAIREEARPEKYRALRPRTEDDCSLSERPETMEHPVEQGDSIDRDAMQDAPDPFLFWVVGIACVATVGGLLGTLYIAARIWGWL